MVLDNSSGKSDADAIAYADKNIDKYVVSGAAILDGEIICSRKEAIPVMRLPYPEEPTNSNTILHCPISTKKVL